MVRTGQKCIMAQFVDLTELKVIPPPCKLLPSAAARTHVHGLHTLIYIQTLIEPLGLPWRCLESGECSMSFSSWMRCFRAAGRM